jgi:arylsulfatase A-like enzyme
VENPMLDPSFGYAQGFSSYNRTWSVTTTTDERIPALEQFAEATQDDAPGKPFFVFVNLIEPHSPYDSSRWFRNTFVSNQAITVESSMTHKYYLGQRTFTVAELRHLNELYDAELLYTDYVVGRMTDELKAKGLWDETALIVTSDHGENIGDHGHMGHRFMLYETAVKIPLLIHWPTAFLAPGSRVSAPVQLTDLFPTMLAIAGIDGNSYPTHGRNLLSLPASGHDEVLCEYYYPGQVLESMTPGERKSPLIAPYLRRMRSLMVGGMKLIWGSDGRNELYDLTSDPGETANLIDSPAYADLSRSMERRLLELVAEYEADRVEAAPTPTETKLDPATNEVLRSLGYIR